MLVLWDGPRQREAYTWFNTEFANLRAAFRWSAATADLDSAATFATHVASLGVWLEQYEPVAWAEELLEPARAVNHRRLLQLYVVAAQCYAAGRTDDAFAYLEASQTLTSSSDFDPDLHERPNLERHRLHGRRSTPTVGRGVPRGDRPRAGSAHDYPRFPGYGAQLPRRRP